MNLNSIIAMSKRSRVEAVGTAEGVKKEWDTRGRKETMWEDKCVGPNCSQPEQTLQKFEAPHMESMEMVMQSDKNGYNIKFDKDALRTMLQLALAHEFSGLWTCRAGNRALCQRDLPSARNSWK